MNVLQNGVKWADQKETKEGEKQINSERVTLFSWKARKGDEDESVLGFGNVPARKTIGPVYAS